MEGQPSMPSYAAPAADEIGEETFRAVIFCDGGVGN